MNHTQLAIFGYWSDSHILTCTHTHTYTHRHTHTHSDWHHTLAQSQFSGMKRSILFSTSNLVFFFRWDMCVDNMRMLPGLCQDFQCSRGVNGWAVNRLHGNGQTSPGWWRTPVSPSKRNSKCVCVRVFWDVFKVLTPFLSFWFLRSGQWCERRVNARFCFFHPHWRALAGQVLAPCSSAPCLLSVSLAQPHLAGLILTRAMRELNLIIVWRVLCGYNTDFTDSIMSRQGGLLDHFCDWKVASSVQTRAKTFFFPSEPYSEQKPTVHEKVQTTQQ